VKIYVLRLTGVVGPF